MYIKFIDVIESLIDDLVACELFSGDHFKSGLLTSKRIQCTYYRCTVERKTSFVDFDIWMLSESEMSEISKNNVILDNFINRGNNLVNRTNNLVNETNNTQSKVK
ncbi:MAG: hypothetical protein RSA27_06385 [Oscillospiraceae bacterium]